MALSFLDGHWTDLLLVERLRDDGHANGDGARCRVVEVVEVTDGGLSQRPKIFSHESAFWFKMAEFSAKYGVLSFSAHGRKLTILFGGSQALIHSVWGEGPRS